MHPRISTRHIDTDAPHILIASASSDRVLVVPARADTYDLLAAARREGLVTEVTLRAAPRAVMRAYDITGASVGQLTERLTQHQVPYDFTTLTEGHETILVASAQRRGRRRGRVQ